MALVLAGAARADDTIQPSGPQTFAIPQCDTPFVLKFFSKTKPVALRTEGVPVTSGAPAPRWTLSWDTPTVGDTTLSEWSSTGKFSGGCPDTAGAAIGVKVYLTVGEPGHLQLKVALDPAPKLAALPGALAAELTRWPWPGIGDDTVRLALHEAGRGSTALPPVQVWADPLKTVSSDPARFHLDPPGLVSVPSGGTADAVFKAVGRLSPGTYATNLYVSGPGGTDIKLVPLTLKVRLDRSLLVALLFAGVLGGWWFNKILTGRLDLQTARAAAFRKVSALLALADDTLDPQTRQDVSAAAFALQGAATGAATPAEVATATQAADDARTAATAAATARSTQFKTALDEQTAIYRPTSPHATEIAQLISLASDRLLTLQARAAGGDVSGALQDLTQATSSLAGDAITAVQAWLLSLLGALGAFGDWTDPALTSARDALKQAVDGAYAAPNVTALLTAADAVAPQLRLFAGATAPPAVAAIFDTAAAASPQLAAFISGKAKAAAAAAALPDPFAILQCLTDLRNDVEAAILKPANTPAQHVLLTAGDFIGALQGLAPPVPKALLALDAAESPHASIVRDALSAGPARLLPGPSLNAPSRLQIGEVQTVLLDWPGAPGAAPAWTLDPPGSAALVPGQGQVTVRGLAPAFATLTATGAGWTAAAKIAIGDPAVAPTEIAAAESRSLGAALTVFTVATTTGLGFAIFQGTWTGVYPDIFAAVSWGLFGQFGLERVRTAVQPVLGKTFSGAG